MRAKRPNAVPDAMDRKILEILGARARVSNRELSRLVGLSPSGALARVRRLEKTGVILGYKAVLAQTVVSGRIVVWASISLASHSRRALRAFETLLLTAARVTDAHKLAGQSDYRIKVQVDTMAEWHALADAWRDAGVEFRSIQTETELATIKRT